MISFLSVWEAGWQASLHRHSHVSHQERSDPCIQVSMHACMLTSLHPLVSILKKAPQNMRCCVCMHVMFHQACIAVLPSFSCKALHWVWPAILIDSGCPRIRVRILCESTARPWGLQRTR